MALGQVNVTHAAAIQNATNDVKLATDLVKKLATGVKTGLASRTELSDAINDLTKKIDVAKKISSLSGLGDGIDYTSLWPYAFLIIIVILLLKK